ncbi:MAG: MFS transporter [Candidatus Poseidoniaceae archaeon]|nr:MFS transporter [Candidatus Poseidoniaceae archaeon]
MDEQGGPTNRIDASKGALFVLFLVTMIDMIGFGIVIPFLTYLVEDLAGEQDASSIGIWVGLLMTSYSAAQFLFSPIWGALSDRIGRRPVLMIGLVGNTVFFTMFGLANTLVMALIARFLAGVFNGNIAVARAYIGDVSSPQQLATRMGLIGAAFGLGFTIGPFLGGELSAPAERWDLFKDTIFDTYPYLLPCVLASVLSIISLLFAFKSLPESLPENRRTVDKSRSWGVTMKNSFTNVKAMIGTKQISSIMWVTFLFMFGFTIMHAVFILYTQMDPASGGLGFSEADNGRIFAIIGVLGIITQGGLIGPLSRKYGSVFVLRLGTVLAGIGLVMVPYSDAEHVWLWLFPITGCIAIGNGLFQPSSSTLLTAISRQEGYELGAVMGAQESLSSFARILGPLTGGFVWTKTVGTTGFLDYHTAFHLCGVMMLCAFLLSLRISFKPSWIQSEE